MRFGVGLREGRAYLSVKTRKFWIVGRSGRCAQWGCLSRRSSRALFVFTIKRAPGAAACAFFPLRKERGHRDFSYSFSFLQKKGRQNYPHSTKQCRRFSETRVFVVSRLLSLKERRRGEDSYLVDPASSHMLVSKIKPCMSKYEHLYCETANGSLNQL